MDPDPNWAKFLDPDLNSMYLDTQHWHKEVHVKFSSIYNVIQHCSKPIYKITASGALRVIHCKLTFPPKPPFNGMSSLLLFVFLDLVTFR